MHQTKTEGKARPTLSLLIVVGGLLSALLLAACGSSSDQNGSGGASAETTQYGRDDKSAEPSSGAAETTVYAKGVPTLKELYANSNEPPPTSGPPAAKDKTVVWVSLRPGSNWVRDPGQSFLEAAKALGWKASIADGKLNVGNGYATRSTRRSPPTRTRSSGFGIGCEEAKTPYEEAKAAGIPVVETQNTDCNDPRAWTLAVQGRKSVHEESKVRLLNSTNATARNQAAYVVDRTKGKAKVLLTELSARLVKESVTDGSRCSKMRECEDLRKRRMGSGGTAPCRTA